MEIQIGGMIGLYGGALIGLIGWYVGRNKAKKQRVLDEIHDHIWQKTRSYSWYLTLFTIYILFTLHGFGITMGVAPVLGIIMIVHIASWGIIGSFLTAFMYSEKTFKTNDFFIGLGVIIISAILFLVLSLITNHWLYLLMSIPFGMVGYLFMKQSKQKES